MAARAEEAIDYERRRTRLPDEVETRPWQEQQAADDALVSRSQLDYLFEHSPFYRDKLASHPPLAGRPGRDRRAAAHREGRAQGHGTPDNPIGAHLCAPPAGHRPDLLDERHHRHAQLHPADRGRPRQLGDRLGAQLRGLRRRAPASASSAPTTPGPFVAGAALAAFDRIGLAHIPVGTGNSERLLQRDRAAEARDRRADPVVRRPPARGRGGARGRPGRARASRACSWRASRAAASPPSGRGSSRAGARPSPRRWASATSGRRCGASASSRTACTWARAASCTPS